MNSLRKLAAEYIDATAKGARKNGATSAVVSTLLLMFLATTLMFFVGLALYGLWQLIGTGLIVITVGLLLIILGVRSFVVWAEAHAEKPKNDDSYDPYSEGRFGALAEDFKEFEAVVRQKREDAQHD